MYLNQTNLDGYIYEVTCLYVTDNYISWNKWHHKDNNFEHYQNDNNIVITVILLDCK